MTRRPWSRQVAAALGGVAALLALAGCTSSGGASEEPTASPGVSVQAPTQADLRMLERQIAALPKATGAALEYTPEKFPNAAWLAGDIESDGTKQELTDLYVEALRVLWNAGQVDLGGFVDLRVRNPETGQVAKGSDVGLAQAPVYAELKEFLGPRPSPTA